MKLSKMIPLYTRWFILSATLTLGTVLIGFYVTHKLTEDDRNKAMGSPAKTFHQLVLDFSAKGNMSLDEAYQLVDKAYGEKFPFTRILIDPKETKINKDEPVFERYKLPDGREIVFYKDHFMRHDNRGLPPDGRHHRKHGFGPPPPPRGETGPFRRGSFYISIITMLCSIVAGVGFSVMFIGLYLRKKSKQAEKIISRLKSGDLKARFDLGKSDEASLLMIKFNEMAEAIEGLVENLRATELARKTLLQELAHDLRTPVASLKNLQETLIEKGDLLDADKKKHVQEMALGEVIYFERLVEDLLFLSGVNDPKYDQSFTDVNLKSLVSQEIELVESGEIDVLFDADEVVSVKGNEHLLRRLIKNVFSNAHRFSQEKMIVSLKADENIVILSVLDDGPGMSQQMIHTFGAKKFSRNIDHSNKDYISIGLGSVIMKKIMILHEGEMEVISHQNPSGLEVLFKFKLS